MTTAATEQTVAEAIEVIYGQYAVLVGRGCCADWAAMSTSEMEERKILVAKAHDTLDHAWSGTDEFGIRIYKGEDRARFFGALDLAGALLAGLGWLLATRLGR